MYNPNDPALRSWVDVPPGSDFPVQNLPFGIFQHRTSAGQSTPRVGVAIGSYVLDLRVLGELGYLDDVKIPDPTVFDRPFLNDFIALGKPVTRAVRERISDLLRSDNPRLRDHYDHRGRVLIYQTEARLLMPVRVGDYTDFYSSIEHATNVGTMFRDPANALLPNWRHLPVGYHGRASSIVVSGTDIRRPNGQTKPPDAAVPVFGPSGQLDFELEMAFVVGKATELGRSIPVSKAEEHIFGLLLFNDWSARDIQAWEYVPLGPFLGKNFASSVSPWVVTLEALAPFRTAGPAQEPPVLPYLQTEGDQNYDIQLEVAIQPDGGAEKRVCRSNARYLYWNASQQLAHHTVNGCNVNVGDLCASGTISGPTPDAYGSLLELAWKGTQPIPMANGSVRTFLLDGDTVTMRGYAEKAGVRIGFGEVRGKIV
ncbi:MAG: fumarylacetoacetase [Ferruginibacter sp.]|nr:fumarylacetoacetase [Cytophagales bacterium]